METNIKTILLAVQQQLTEQVPELAYIDKNWGQFDYDMPPVKWPCVLLDIDTIPFTQTGGGGQIADGATVEIMAGNLRLVSSSAAAPNKADAYFLIELLDKFTQPSSGSPMERSARCSARRSRRSLQFGQVNVTRFFIKQPIPFPAYRKTKASNCRRRPFVWR